MLMVNRGALDDRNVAKRGACPPGALDQPWIRGRPGPDGLADFYRTRRRSIALHRNIEQFRVANTLLFAVVDRAPFGVIVFDTRSKPLLVNHVATTVFSAGDGLTLRNGLLRASNPQTQSLLESSLAAALQVSDGILLAAPPPVLVPRAAGARSYQVTFLPLNLRTSSTELPAGAACLALIHDRPSAGRSPVAATLVATYGLTRAEVRVGEALFEGRTLPEAASELNISRNTAKTHLGRIFDKTGVRSQAALLRLMALGAQTRC